jgi:hypothetical protein
MKTTNLLTASLLFGALLIVGPAWADELDGTLSLVDENETPADVVHRIELPEGAAERAQEAAAFGLETAERARSGEQGEVMREEGRQFGENTAEQARERGRQIADDARQGGRGEQLRESITDRDAAPGRPDLPARPELPQVPTPPVSP